MEMVGIVRFETADGQPCGERMYAKHVLLRPFQIAFGGTWYEQNRKDAEGAWVYRATRTLPGSMANDPALLEIE